MGMNQLVSRCHSYLSSGKTSCVKQLPSRISHSFFQEIIEGKNRKDLSRVFHVSSKPKAPCEISEGKHKLLMASNIQKRDIQMKLGITAFEYEITSLIRPSCFIPA